MTTSTRLAALSFLTAAVLGVTGCSAGQSPATSTSNTRPATAPATVTVGGEEIRPDEKPVRIAALSSDVASLVAAIARPENIALITDLGEDTPDGPQVLTGDHGVDPELLLSAAPDLVLLTGRHGQEKDSGALLEQAGVRVAQFDAATDWKDIDAILRNIDTLGTMLGERERAAQLRAEIEAVRSKVHSTPAPRPAPRVLALMSRGSQRMVVPSSALLHGLITEAGGDVLSAGSGGPAPADPELIASLNPDIILIEDFRGRGRQDFGDILANPAVSQVPAVAHAQVHYLPSDRVTVAGAAFVGDGLTAVADAVSSGEND